MVAHSTAFGDNLAEDEQTLLHTALFKHVPVEDARQLLPHLQHQVFHKGEYIFHEGDEDTNMYIIERGRIKLTRESYDHRIQLLSISGAGEIAGEIPVFDPHGGPRTASAVSMVNSTSTLSLTSEVLFSWLSEHPRVAVNMLQVLARRMRRNNERISDLVFMDVPARLSKTLIDLAKRFGEPSVQGLVVPHDLTQEELAQLVGTSRETVNKALMEFTNRGWIAREGRTIIIYQPGKLILRAQH
ncbi:Crp/Fnr family transcriptional regulator [Alloscardovia theropitheci]|uniref:Crp/Fnr family transcriptional regulator n=1 Tax=Alloscardovia theropitheci TaxID=2496842 RepID=A0A4R0QTA9_9BIFI|nr:Crp/Fnr family transcriptional regulator [Alloscardovia theropitheci]TCD54475.1 Crp/Fnr family transcriptional regulator [Alloscardovia theropitheci]